MVELLIVIAIIGIIATVAIPLLLVSRQLSLDEKARQSVRIVLSAEQSYYASHGEYGTLGQLANSDPPYIDERFGGGSGIMGNAMVIDLVITDGGDGFEVTASNPGGTMDFTADETMTINESPH